MSLLQAKYKELQAALANASSDEEAAKIVSELNGVESKLISQQGVIDKTQTKLSEYEETFSNCGKTGTTAIEKLKKSLHLQARR